MRVIAIITAPKVSPTSMRNKTTNVGDAVSLLHTIPYGVVDHIRTIIKYNTLIGTCRSFAINNKTQINFK
ncbi:MAG: hypothetical protein ACTH59_08730 [Pseudoalteromonas nigrifaciens]|uniref:hypothetical protein n=1 Tax=Pseudoalteromonas nigrifaciens TaxID=28109 RepID=UPI003F97AD09